MGFLQIITFDTYRLDEFLRLENDWSQVTADRRTLVGAQVFADRDQAGLSPAETEERVVTETGALGPRIAEVVS